MCASPAPSRSDSVKLKLGLVVVTALLPLVLGACASTSSPISQALLDSHGTFLTPPAPPAAAKPAKPPEPLKLTAAVPEEDLQEMRGCLGVYYFSYNFDLDLVATPQVKVSSNFQAVLPDGSPAPTTNGTTAVFRDNNVSFTAGPTSGGLASQLLVTGHDNIVFANAQFNIHIPNASTLTSTVNVLPASSLAGIGVK